MLQWCMDMFITGSCCVVILACYMYVFYVVWDTVSSWRHGWQYLEWEYFFFAACAFAVMLFGLWTLLVGRNMQIV